MTRRASRGPLGAALLALALVALPSAVATPLAAQIARPQKSKLELEPRSLTVAPGATLGVEALATVESGWHLQAHVPTHDYLIPTVLTVELPVGFATPKVEYPAPSRYRFAFAGEELDVYEGVVRMPFTVAVPADAAPGALRIAATLRYQACDDKSCLPPVETSAEIEVDVVAAPTATMTTPPAAALAQSAEPLAAPTSGVAASAEAAATAPPAPGESALAAPALPTATSATAPASDPAPPSLLRILLFALIGGLILNGMPCVLPIVSLKLFGLVKAAGEAQGRVRAGALATTAGILFSFWALAAAAIAARSAGAAVGWGVQFQQPGFVAFLAIVVLLFSLNLWGLFEIPLPQRLARLGDSAGGDGLGGHFASGLFATLMATPCSAPFLGTALTFALGQSPATIFATLTAVGLGLALPYVALAVWPGFVRALPKPGAWMDTLRGAMGFLLAAALVWLLYVLGAQIASESVAFFELGLLAAALAVWIASRSAHGGTRRRLAWSAALALAIGSVLLANGAPRAASRAANPAGDATTIAWQPYDRARAEQLAASGRLVFLDITADWCVTCKVNERVILHTPEMVAAFRRYDVVAMKADWTNRDDEIARFLAAHGRYGIPFYMLYRPGAAPHVFGELITKQGVIDVLEASADD